MSLRQQYIDMLREIVEDADGAGCEGVYVVDAILIDQARELIKEWDKEDDE